MKKRVLIWFMLIVFAFSGMTAWAKPNQVQKETWEMTGFQVSWYGGVEDEYGIPSYSNLSIEKQENGNFRLFLGREYFENEEYNGFYEFTADLPADTLDLRKSFKEPFSLDLEVDGMAVFYPPFPEEPLAVDKNGEVPPDYEEPVPYPETRRVRLYAEPGDPIRLMLNSRYRTGELKSNDMTKGQLTNLFVTGSLDGEEFSSPDGSLQMIIVRNVTIGTYEDVPMEARTNGSSIASAKGKPQTTNFSQMYMQAWTENNSDDYSEWLGVSLYLGTDTLEIYTDYSRFDPVNQADVNEYFSGYIENYTWDPADFAGGTYSMSLEVTGVLTRFTYDWNGTEPIEETFEITRQYDLTFDMTQIGTTRSILKIGSRAYSVKERTMGTDYSGSATISIDGAGPIRAQGYATYIKGTSRLTGTVLQ